MHSCTDSDSVGTGGIIANSSPTQPAWPPFLPWRALFPHSNKPSLHNASRWNEWVTEWSGGIVSWDLRGPLVGEQCHFYRLKLTPIQFLLETLEDLGEQKLKPFHWYLQNPKLLDGFEAIRKCRLEKADRLDTVDVMVEMYTTEHVMEVTSSILNNIKMNKG